MYDLKKILEDAKNNASKRSNNGLELEVMRNMLNDPTYEVGVYKAGVGEVDKISMYQTSRNLVSSIISNSTDINKEEARHLADNYEFNKDESSNFIAISKEFINVYSLTGNKMLLGSRQETNFELTLKKVEEKERIIKPGGVGNPSETESKSVVTPEHNTLKVSGKNIY